MTIPPEPPLEVTAARLKYAREVIENVLTDQSVALSAVQRNALQRVAAEMVLAQRVFATIESRRRAQAVQGSPDAAL